MEIQGKEFGICELIFYVDYARSEHAGAAGSFQVVDISIEGNSETSILKYIEIDSGKHYFDINELFNDLNLDSKKASYRVETV